MFSFSACVMCLGAHIDMRVKYILLYILYIYIYNIYIIYIYIYYIPLPSYSNYNPVDKISTKTDGRFSQLLFSIFSYPQSPPGKPIPKATHLTPRKNN